MGAARKRKSDASIESDSNRAKRVKADLEVKIEGDDGAGESSIIDPRSISMTQGCKQRTNRLNTLSFVFTTATQG